MSQRAADEPVGDTVLVHAETNTIHKLRFAQTARCGSHIPNLERRASAEALQADENEKCSRCFEPTTVLGFCPVLTRHDDSEFKSDEYGELEGFKAYQPCQNCYETPDGMTEPDESDTVLYLGNKSSRRVHDPNNIDGNGGEQ